MYDRAHALVALMRALIRVRTRFGEQLKLERRRERTHAHTRVTKLRKKATAHNVPNNTQQKYRNSKNDAHKRYTVHRYQGIGPTKLTVKAS